MALKAKDQVKVITASGGGTLEADSDESFRVKDILCVPSTNDTYLTLYIKGVTVGKFRVKGKTGNHLPFPHVKTVEVYERVTGGLLSSLRAHGVDITFPVASGETFTVARAAEAGYVAVVYDIYESADVKPDEVNGSMSKTRRYLHYIDNAAAIEASPYLVTNSLIWSGGDKWPVDAAAVAENNTFRLLGILGSPSARGNGSANKGYTTYLQLMRESNVLFDEDHAGLPFKGDSGQTADAESYVSLGSIIGPLTAENPAPPLLFDPALEFVEGQKLTINVLLSGAASGGIGANALDLALILESVYGG